MQGRYGLFDLLCRLWEESIENVFEVVKDRKIRLNPIRIHHRDGFS